MRKFSTLATLTVPLALAAQPAAAETFDGPYIGVQAGWVQNKIGQGGSGIGPVTLDEQRDAAQAGIFAGYNFRLATNIVISAEAGFQAATDDDVSTKVGDVSTSVDPRYSIDLGARAGYLVSPRTLLYVRGGYEHLRARVTRTGGPNPGRSNDDLDGWSVGGGIEHALLDRVSLRAEYRYGEPDNGGDFERHQALVGVAYHF